MSINLGQLLNRDNLNAAFMSKVDDNNILGSVTLTGAGAKLGVGTGTPSKALHIVGDAIIAGSGSTIGGANIANANLLIGSTTSGIGIDTNEIFAIGSDFYIGTIGAAAIKFRNGSTDIMTLNNNGNVSIGNSITDTRLTIEGTHASNTKIMTFGAGTSRSLKLTKTDGISVDGPLYLQPNTTDNVFLASGGGKVAIGSATAPTKALDVTGDIRLTGDFYSNAATVEFYTDAVAALPIKAGSLVLSDSYSDVAPANGLFVKGNVGVGGTPSTKLHIQGGNIRLTDTAGSALGFDLIGYTSTHSLWLVAKNTTEPTNAYVVIGTAQDWDRQVGINYTPGTTGAGAGLLQIGQTQKNNANFTHGETAFYTNGTEKVRIDKDGDVGIGVSTITAGYKLEVNGSAKLSGGLNLAGAITYDDVSRYWLATTTNWGIYWDTANNEIEFHGAGATKFSVDLDNGLTFIDGNLTFNGNTATNINQNRHTTSNTAGTNLTVQAGGATVGATDKAGGNLVLASGIATGTGSSAIVFQTATAGTSATTDRSPTTKWTIKSDGTFEAAAEAYISSATGLVQISSAGGANISLSPGAGGVQISSTTSTGYALQASSNTITSGNVARITSTSGMGTASGSTKVLELFRSGTNLASSHTAYGIHSTVMNTGTTSTNIAGYFSASGGATNYGLVVPNGNVGFGTAAPEKLVHIESATGGAAMLRIKNTNTTSSGFAEMHLANDAENALVLGSIGSGYTADGWVGATYLYNTGAGRKMYIKSMDRIDFFVGGDQALTGRKVSILADGKVGIGTVAPSQMLEVNGTVKATTFTKADGTEVSYAGHTHVYNLDNLSNVTMTNKQANDTIRWNGTAWVNAPLTTNGATPIRQEFTATANQTVFTLTNGSYITGANMLSIYIWGQKQPPSAYTETSGTSFTLAAGVPAGTKVLAEWFSNITLGAEGKAGQVLNYTLTNVSTDNQGRLWKTGGTNSSWDAAAHSAEAYTGGCFLSFKVNTTSSNIMIGLNQDPATDATYTGIDYAWYLNAGAREVRENGTNVWSGGTYAVGDVFAISYDNLNVKYYHNGTLVKTTAAAAGLSLAFDSSFYQQAASYQIYDVYFSPAGPVGPAGAKGDPGVQGLPGDPGATGPQGNVGGIQYKFSTTVTDADPGAGFIRFNNATLSSVTQIFIDDVDVNSSNMASYISTWGDSTSSNKGFITIAPNVNGGTAYAIFRVTGTVTAATGYKKIPVAYVSGTAFANNDRVAIGFHRSGDVGTAGTFKRQEFTATANQTVFDISVGSYTPNSNTLAVYIWGVRQPPSAYTETSSTRFTLTAGVPVGTKVLVEIYEGITMGLQGNASQILNYTLNGVSVDSQGRLWKSSGTNGVWDASAHSAEAYTGGCFLSFKVKDVGSNIMMALNTDPSTDSSYVSLDYAWYLSAGTRSIYESGANPWSSGTYAVGDVFAISYDNANIRYYHNGTLVRTIAATAGLKFSLDSSFYHTSASYQIYDIFFGPQGATGAASNHASSHAPGGTDAIPGIKNFWYQATQPTAITVGDMWMNTSNVMKFWNGSAWIGVNTYS